MYGALFSVFVDSFISDYVVMCVSACGMWFACYSVTACFFKMQFMPASLTECCAAAKLICVLFVSGAPIAVSFA